MYILRVALLTLVWVLLMLVLVLLHTEPAPADSGRPRELALYEGHGLQCVVAWNESSSMAASGSSALWCRSYPLASGAFEVVGR